MAATHAGRRAGALAALFAGGAALAGACGTSPAADFCGSYGTVMAGLLTAAREYSVYPEEFGRTLKYTMDELPKVRAKAPDDRLRQAFDTASFTFSVFSDGSALADFLARANLSDNAVVRACSDYGVPVSVG